MADTGMVDTVEPFAKILLEQTSLEKRCNAFLTSDKATQAREAFVASIDNRAFAALRSLGYTVTRTMLRGPVHASFIRDEAKRAAWTLTRDWMNRGIDAMTDFGLGEVALDTYFEPVKTDVTSDAAWNQYLKEEQLFLRHVANDLALEYTDIRDVLGEAYSPTTSYLRSLNGNGRKITPEYSIFLRDETIAMSHINDV